MSDDARSARKGTDTAYGCASAISPELLERLRAAAKVYRRRIPFTQKLTFKPHGCSL